MLHQVETKRETEYKKEENFPQTHISKVIASPSNGSLGRFLLRANIKDEVGSA